MRLVEIESLRLGAANAGSLNYVDLSPKLRALVVPLPAWRLLPPFFSLLLPEVLVPVWGEVQVQPWNFETK